MKRIYNWIIFSLTAACMASCSEDILEKEQYKKEVYLVGAYDRVWTTTVDYSNEEVETYFTISSSGTLPLDKNVTLDLKISEELVDIYNQKYWTILNEDKFYKPLDQSLYTIPSMDNVLLDHSKGISVKVPVFIKTKDIDVDQGYVIPVEIEKSTPYPVSESGVKMLILLKMRNAYSGDYAMDGYTNELENGEIVENSERHIYKDKTVTPTGINTVRIFYAMNNDSEEKADIQSKTLQLTVLDENYPGSEYVKKVKVDAWHPETWSASSKSVIDTGEGYYDPKEQKFYIKYQIDNMLYEETLEKKKTNEEEYQ